MVRHIGLVLAILGSLTSWPAAASLVDRVNQIRSRGCDDKPGVASPLRASRGLDEVAHEWSKGGSLQDAISRTGYRIVLSSSMRVAGPPDERTLLKVLADNYCSVILDTTYTEIGIHRRGTEVWIVLAQPFTAPGAPDAANVAAQVLQLVNEARAQARKCGARSYKAARPLELSAMLTRAALAHAQDMARHEFLEHQGSDGSRPAGRVARTGYRWRTVGENIAAGPRDAQAVVREWLDSPAHCANIMSAHFREMGVAYVVDPRSMAGIYWAQVFASPR